MNFKTCNKCGESKPLTDFYKHKSMKDGRHNQCKSCHNKQTADSERKRKETNPDAYWKSKRTTNARRKYGVSYDEYQKILSKGECEVCGSRDDLVYHHHHKTNKAACLCRRCNASIGGLNDDPDLLLKAYELQRRLSQ